MVLDLLAAVVAESVLWLSLNHLIDEIRRLNAPANGNFLLLDLHLLCKDVVSDLFARFSYVGTFSIHAFVGHNSHGKIVHGVRMILPAHHLRRHVARRSGRVLSVLFSPVSGDSEICDSEVALVVDDQVLGLDVSVYDLLIVTVFETGHEACNEEAYIFEK